MLRCSRTSLTQPSGPGYLCSHRTASVQPPNCLLEQPTPIHPILVPACISPRLSVAGECFATLQVAARSCHMTESAQTTDLTTCVGRPVLGARCELGEPYVLVGTFLGAPSRQATRISRPIPANRPTHIRLSYPGNPAGDARVQIARVRSSRTNTLAFRLSGRTANRTSIRTPLARSEVPRS